MRGAGLAKSKAIKRPPAATPAASQTPIREALSMLEATGLVTKQYFIGYCTAPKLNRKQFEELYEIRLLIEPYAAARATERMSDEQLEQLGSFASRMKPQGA